MYINQKKIDIDMINRILQFITLLLLVLVVYYILKVYIQDAVILNAGSGNDRNYYFFVPDSRTAATGAVGATAIGLLKYCPPKSRPMVTISMVAFYTGGMIANNVIDKKYGGGGRGGSTFFGGNATNFPNSSGNGEGTSRSVLSNTDILTILKEKVLGAPIKCEGSSWYPYLDKVNELLIGFSDDEKFIIGIILLLSGVLIITINIILSVITRLIINKPLNNKYMERLRIWWSKSNNVTLIILFILQLLGLIYTIYILGVYIGFIYYS